MNSLTDVASSFGAAGVRIVLLLCICVWLETERLTPLPPVPLRYRSLLALTVVSLQACRMEAAS